MVGPIALRKPEHAKFGHKKILYVAQGHDSNLTTPKRGRQTPTSDHYAVSSRLRAKKGPPVFRVLPVVWDYRLEHGPIRIVLVIPRTQNTVSLCRVVAVFNCLNTINTTATWHLK